MREADRELRLMRTASVAEPVYGGRARALEWLRKPHPRLDGRTPLPVLKTEMGSRMAEELLVQNDEGMFV